MPREEVARRLRSGSAEAEAGHRSRADAAQDVPTNEPNAFEIRNRDGGQVIDLTVHGDVSATALDDVERRLLRLIAVRQPARLNVDIRSTTLRMSTDQLARAREALADVGGVLVATTDVGPPAETSAGS